jgi:beta-galactosidase
VSKVTDARVRRLRERLGRIGYGGDYNPEQWPEDVWVEDVELMRAAEVSMVTVGVFGWAVVESEPGAYDFTVFDQVLRLLSDAGLSVCLATMTASPPPWLAARHPETLPQRADGTRLWPGGRQHFCPSSPVYRDHATRLVERLAERYGEHPALALWHVGNEYGCHVGACYCDVSAVAFRDWLHTRYGDVEGLNDAWSTRFWSQRYGSFDEVQPPRTAPTFPNPAHQLDFARFSSDELLGCFRAEKDVLDRITPDVPVTTNFVPLTAPPGKHLDLFAWAPHLDVVSYDSYPDPHDDRAAMRAGFAYDVIRGLRHGQPWLLMEQAPSAVNWRPVNGPKPPGVMALWSWQAIAHGADALMFFQWRQSRGGAEKFHSGMVPHGGADTRVFREVRELGRSLAAVPDLAGAAPRRADVAMVLDWPSWWAFELDSHPSTAERLLDVVYAHYAPLYDAGVAVDVVPPTADLDAYRLVVVPNLYLVDAAAAANLERYVAAGGTLLMSYFSGIVDGSDRVHPGGYPAPFRQLLGLTVEEFWPLPDGRSVRLAGDLGAGDLGDGVGTVWSEDIRLEGAEAFARFAAGDLDGRPAVTRHGFGDGSAWYVGTRPEPTTMRRLLDRVRADAGVEPVLADLPAGVQARVREAPSGQAYWILLNHGSEPATVRLPTRMHDAFSDAAPASAVRLEPCSVAVLTAPS